VTPALAARGLTKRYDDVAAVDAIDLQVERGELFGFLGPNGAGKTTTIRMALGLIYPTAGEIEVLGERVGIDRAPLARVGALVEEPAFWKYLSGRKNLEYFARSGVGADRVGTRSRLDRVDEVLEEVGLSAAAQKRVKAYSQGMRQRLGLGLALLGQPELLVLDEPTNGLDPSGMREMRMLLRRLADGGTTIFVSSHLLAEVEAMCDRVAVMAQGRLVGEGPPSVLRGDARSLRVEVDDLVLAREVAGRLRGVELDGERQGGTGAGPLELRLGIGDGDADAGELNAALVAAGIRVTALMPRRDSLEDVFLHLVEGADVPR
jgi:ABC-2 type transport system ATP-binding protein